MRLNIKTDNFTVLDANGNPIDKQVFVGAISRKLTQALGEVIYGLDGANVQEETLEFTVGRGQNAATYQIKKPADDVEIELSAE